MYRSERLLRRPARGGAPRNDSKGLKKMIIKLVQNVKGERGQVTALVVMFLPIFILLMGWSIDVGRILAARAELGKATDIAAREVAKEIDMTRVSVSGEQERIDLSSSAEGWVRSNLQGLTGGTLNRVTLEQDTKYIYIEAEATVPLLFSVLTGKTKTAVKARGIGRLRTVK